MRASTTLPPGPALPPLAQVLRYAADPLATLDRWSRRYGDTFTARFAGLGSFVFTSAPEHIRAIFTAAPGLLDAGAQNAGLVPLVGKRSLLTLDGPEHRRHRKLILPLFHGDRVRGWGEAIEAATLESMGRWPLGRAFALQPHLFALTLRVTVRTLFGFEAEADVSRWTCLFARLLAQFSSPWIPLVGLCGFLGTDVLALLPWLPPARVKAEVDRALLGEIARRRAEPDPAARDGFSLLCAAKDEHGAPLSADELRDELLGLLAAGHETVAGTLAWVVERLLTHPEALDRLLGELDGFDLARAHEPSYLEAVIQETLRQRPVLGVVARRTRQPFSLGPFELPAGVYLAPSIYLLHRRADLYPEPDRFRPERFLGGRPKAYEWIPFGGGGRRCIGMAFSFFELKIVLATIFRHQRLRLCAAGPARIARRNITLVPAGDLPVIREPWARAA